jgi:hypothetical protein
LYTHQVQFDFAEQKMGSIPADRERHPLRHIPFSLCLMSAITCTQALILTFTPVADGFSPTSCPTFPLISTRSAGGLSNSLLDLSIATYDKKAKGFNLAFIFTTDKAKRVVARLLSDVSSVYQSQARPAIRIWSEYVSWMNLSSVYLRRSGCLYMYTRPTWLPEAALPPEAYLGTWDLPS